MSSSDFDSEVFWYQLSLYLFFTFFIPMSGLPWPAFVTVMVTLLTAFKLMNRDLETPLRPYPSVPNREVTE